MQNGCFVPLHHYLSLQGCPTQSMAFKHSTFPPEPPIHTTGLKIAHFKGVPEIVWANMDQICLKIALDLLFDHPE